MTEGWVGVDNLWIHYSYNVNRRSVFDLRQKKHYTSFSGSRDCGSRVLTEALGVASAREVKFVDVSVDNL
jgi:hypothetical protein